MANEYIYYATPSTPNMKSSIHTVCHTASTNPYVSFITLSNAHQPQSLQDYQQKAQYGQSNFETRMQKSQRGDDGSWEKLWINASFCSIVASGNA
jgi:hypothetical protein